MCSEFALPQKRTVASRLTRQILCYLEVHPFLLSYFQELWNRNFKLQWTYIDKWQVCVKNCVWLFENVHMSVELQVNLCQKLLFLHQLTHNMKTDCSLNYKFNTSKFQAQTWGEHVVYRIFFWHSEQFLYTTCSPHVLQKEELLTKIYLYYNYNQSNQSNHQLTSF